MSSPQLSPAQHRAEMLANIFDLRMFIGSVFAVSWRHRDPARGDVRPG